MNNSPSYPNLTQHLYGVDTNGNLDETIAVPTDPSNPWQTRRIGGPGLVGTPAVGGSTGSLRLFVGDHSGNLCMFEQTGDSWLFDNVSQDASHSPFSGTVVTISGTPVVLDNIYAIGSDGSLLFFNFGSTTAWAVHAASFPTSPGTLVGSPTGFLDSQGVAQLFARTSAGALLRLFNTGGTWQWQSVSLPNQPVASDAALAQGADTSDGVVVYAIEVSGILVQFISGDSSLSSWTSLPLPEQVGQLFFDPTCTPLVIASDDGPFIFAVTSTTE